MSESEKMRKMLILLENIENTPKSQITEENDNLGASRSKLGREVLIPMLKDLIKVAGERGEDIDAFKSALTSIESGRRIGDNVTAAVRDAMQRMVPEGNNLEEGFLDTALSGIKAVGSGFGTGLGMISRLIGKAIASVMILGAPAGLVAAALAGQGGAIIPTIGIVILGLMLWDATGDIIQKGSNDTKDVEKITDIAQKLDASARKAVDAWHRWRDAGTNPDKLWGDLTLPTQPVRPDPRAIRGIARRHR
jgi:hypothetical protein